jgi:hypothetical protein
VALKINALFPPVERAPAVYIEMARKVLGEIDLDPASGEIAQRNGQGQAVVFPRKRMTFQNAGHTPVVMSGGLTWHPRVT